MKTTFALAIHGGAGTIRPDRMTAEKEQAYRKALQLALAAGGEILEKGGSALAAVEAAVQVMEDSPLFNAGKGAVYTHAGTHEMEASMMCGKTLEAGAVAGIKTVKNPIQLAHLVLQDPAFVFLTGEGAEEYALEKGVPAVAPDYFNTELRYRQWQKLKNSAEAKLDHTEIEDKKFGTVGAAALDQNGNLAAATSTGGLTNKRFGRLGDSAVIGSGTYANNQSCAVSCTGYGEFFLRAVVGHEVHSRMFHANMSLQQACDSLVKEDLVQLGGEGGLIAVDASGNICLSFNSEGMYRGWLSHEQTEGVVDIFR